ncbi:MFS transporter [Spirochaeta cellobiosiphila]|uniref:MFS transporter n=1 Tax=Spirochaeta cellobiosiphila TaxID=504483 RepID=UPI0004066D70|nr:MFS transporter [Spirochaeta cellobiosiphila]
MKDSKKQIISWSLYDWANSAFSTTVMAGFFPVFFKSYWSTSVDPTYSTFHLGWTNSVASLFIALIAPFLGAIADKSRGKKRFLLFFLFIGVLGTACLYLIGQGQWQMAAFAYILGIVGFLGSNIFYDSLLVDVASPKKIDFVSSLGFSLGYIGGGLLFLVNIMMYTFPSLFHIADEVQGIKLSFLSVAIWWTLFSLPLFLFVPEGHGEKALPIHKSIKAGWQQLKNTFAHIRQLKMVGLFLLAYWFYIDGVDTIIRMSVDYGSSIGLPASGLVTALLLVQFVGFPAAILYNMLGTKIGIKKAIIIAIGAYALLTLAGFFMKTSLHFYLLAIGIGLFQGGIQALSRSYYTRLIPEEKAGEFFGFFNMLGKFAAILGPLLIGLVALITKSNRFGILSLLILFLIGAILLAKVDEKQGLPLEEAPSPKE